MVASVTACNHNNTSTPQTNFEKSLISAIDNFSSNKFVSLDGSYNIDQIDNSSFKGSFDLNMHQAKVDINEESYYYFSSTRFIGQTDGIIIKDYITFDNMQKLFPTTMLNFYYDNGNIRNLVKKNNIYMFEFIDIGAKYSFHSDYDLIGGNMNIFVDDNNNITKTIVSSKYMVGTTPYTYLSITNYEILDEYVLDIPQILPTSDTRYAQYAIKQLSAINEGKTLIEETIDFDTMSELADIPNIQSTMKKVISQVNENIVTLTVEYNSPLLVVGVNTNITKLEFYYTLNNEFLSLKVNDGKKYIL